MNHCKPGEDCTCSEKTEKRITELFYQCYSLQCTETGGELVDGKMTLYFYNPFRESTYAASLDEDGRLVVKDKS